MDEGDWLAGRFRAHADHLRTVAYRMLGSATEAEDAVQESWLRLNRSDTSGVENLGGWLTTVVGRVCLDMLRSRRSRQEDPVGVRMSESLPSRQEGNDPEHEALLADSVGLALLVVLDTLDPAERLAFVLHDMFAVPFDEIAVIVGRSPAAARQLASRARRRVHNSPPAPDADVSRQRELVGAFLAASRTGDFDALLAVLDPDVVLRTDDGAGGTPEVRGASAVAGRARTFSERNEHARLALVNGRVGIVVAPRGRLVVALGFVITGDTIRELDIFTTPDSLDALDLAVLPD